MIIVLKKDISESDLDRLQQKLRQTGCDFRLYENGEPLVRVLSKQNLLPKDFFLSQPGVQDVFRVTPGYRLSARQSPQQRWTLQISDIRLDESHFAIIAGPCAVESDEQIASIARRLSRTGVRFLRGG